MNENALHPNCNLNPSAHEQIDACVNLLKETYEQDLLAIYLYGSAVIGGLQKYSDIDLFVVINRSTTPQEKARIATTLLDLSGLYMKSHKAPLELTIVEQSHINPWKYPPLFDFQYGEWLREPFEQGNWEPWPSKEMPDLAIIMTQILLASRTLIGPHPAHLLCQVPHEDFMKALKDALPILISDLESDTRNSLLTLARVWCTVATDTLCSKPAAAEWAISMSPETYHPVMRRAQAICVGKESESWGDIKGLIKPCAEFMVNHINREMNQVLASEAGARTIKMIQ
ncbi:MAG: aminoglycoside adenylyltransferase domain-containing protein [Holosporales bacterium]